jgi:hypothetical protein
MTEKGDCPVEAMEAIHCEGNGPDFTDVFGKDALP